jgi:hypothetical protein
MAHLDGGPTATTTSKTGTPTTTKTAKALKSDMNKRKRLYAKCAGAGDHDGTAALAADTGITSQKALRRAKWLNLADQAQRAGDHDLASSCRAMAVRGTKVSA